MIDIDNVSMRFNLGIEKNFSFWPPCEYAINIPDSL